MSTPQNPDRNLALELVRVTETAAIAAAPWVGRGEKNLADQAAVEAMRKMINTVDMSGVVVIGEGEKDDAPMLHNGEEVGMYDPSAVFYMNKIVTGPEAAGVIDINASTKANIQAVAKAKGMSVSDITVVVLNRPRHDVLLKEIREAGARIRLIQDGDVAAAIETARPETGIDLLMGIGGTPEGVITAAAMICLGGSIQGLLHPKDADEKVRAIAAGHDLKKVLSTRDLINSDDVFLSATGITDGELLRGIRYTSYGSISESLVMRGKSQTVRLIQTEHHLK